MVESELIVNGELKSNRPRGSVFLLKLHFCNLDFYMVPVEGTGWDSIYRDMLNHPRHWRYDHVKSVKGFHEEYDFYGVKIKASNTEPHWWNFLGNDLSLRFYIQESAYLKLKEFLLSILTLNGKIQMV